MLKNCCCFSLKTGSIVCGVLNLVSYSGWLKTPDLFLFIILFISNVTIFIVFSILFLISWIYTIVAADVVLWTWLDVTYTICAILNVIVSILLLYGSVVERRWYLMPWMIFDCIALGFFTILVIIFTVLLTWQLVLFLLLLIPGWFFWVVVMSFFVDMRDREGAGKGYQVNRSQPTAATISYPNQPYAAAAHSNV